MIRDGSIRPRERVVLPLVAACAVTVACLCGIAAPAVALAGLQGGASRAVAWRVSSRAYPTDLPPGGKGFVEVDLYDVGAQASGGTVTVTDTLPAGVKYTGVQPTVLGGEAEPWTCAGSTVVTCTNELQGKTEQVVGNGQYPIDLEVTVPAVPEAEQTPGAFTNAVSASGGGAASGASATGAVTLSSTPAGFGIADFEAWLSNPDGTSATQAGSHPYEMTVSFDINTTAEAGQPASSEHMVAAGSEVRNITAELPQGLVGDPLAAPQCPRRLFDNSACPSSTQVGVDDAFLGNSAHSEFAVYNLVPPPGMPAQLAVSIAGVKVFLDIAVRSGSDYGVTVDVEPTAQRDIVSNQTIVWGVPADPSHDPERCIKGFQECGLPGDEQETPFLTLPTSCAEPVPRFELSADAWIEPALNQEAGETFPFTDSYGQQTSLTGCGQLDVDPTIAIAPETSYADTPTGLLVDLRVPQEGLLEKEGLATADIRDTKVTLPAGLVVNPGRAAGLQACQPSQDGITSEAEKAEGREDTGPAECPESSKIGTVTIATPLLPEKLEGNLYILQSDPPNLRLLIAASADGVNVKLLGTAHLDETTGQLTTTFNETPELPFTELTLTIEGGAQAALATPTGCGTYTSATDVTPWSTPFTPDVPGTSSFLINGGPGGTPCAGPLPFSPVLAAGSTSTQAGHYTTFSMLLSRADGQQRISSLRFQTPAGLLATIAKIPLCEEPQAAQGTCPQASQIGHTLVQSGPGAYPLTIPEAGRPEAPIYLTGGYEGAPYGLSVVVPVLAGPFDLGTVVVRARIEVDPHTAQLTITTDPLPQILDGVPTDLRTIDAVIDRPEFMFNPTNCTSQQFTGAATSAEGASAAISSHFQVGSCSGLPFQPSFTASTAGKASKAKGASLVVKIASKGGPGASGEEANIRSVKVDLPKQLPSRLSTLQKACLAKVFEANPAGCPKESDVGTAIAKTPVLANPLTGPAYLVSHGNEAFPDLEIVLQGEGVKLVLDGNTLIKKGVTSSTFKTVPDAPITTFELKLPTGKFSILGTDLPESAHYSLCGQTLNMPTAITGQNGAEIHDTTAIGVSGCAKAKTLTRAQKLSKALKVCKKKAKSKRSGCEKTGA